MIPLEDGRDHGRVSEEIKDWQETLLSLAMNDRSHEAQYSPVAVRLCSNRPAVEQRTRLATDDRLRAMVLSRRSGHRALVAESLDPRTRFDDAHFICR